MLAYISGSVGEELLKRNEYLLAEKRLLREFMMHYHREKNHQGLGNALVLVPVGNADHDRPIACQKRMGGLLNFYHREAA